MTLFGVFARQAAAEPLRPALITAIGRTSYGDLAARIQQLAGRMAAVGAGPGPVALCLDDQRLMIAAFFASAAAGRPALVLDPSWTMAACGVRLVNLGAAMVVTTRPDLPRGGIPILDPTQPDPHAPPCPPPHTDGDAECYWGFTSGTTGAPKAFARSHRSWLDSFAAAERVFEFRPADRVAVPGSLSHSLFLYGAVHALCRGLGMVLTGCFRPRRVMAALRACRATHLYAVPAMLAELMRCEAAAPTLRTVFCGGARLSDPMRRAVEAAWPGIDLVEFYGASELSFVSYRSRRAPAPAGSVGRPFPGVRIAIRETDGRPAAPHSEGIIHVSSPMLFRRYVGHAPIAAVGRPAWATVSDRGYVDAGGFLHLTGRQDRVINSKGVKINPEAVETALQDLAGVRRAAVVGLPDERRGEIVAAIVEFAGEAPISRHELSRHCRARLGDGYSPYRYYAAVRLPLTASGKVAVVRLRAALLAGSEDYREIP